MSTETDIRRKVELWLCYELNTALALREDDTPALRAFPAMGGNVDETGDDTNDATDIPAGPYVGVRTLDAEERLVNSEETWQVTAEVIYISHTADVTSPKHARDARAIRDILVEVAKTAPGTYEPLLLRVHGCDVMTGEAYNDSEDQTHGSGLRVALGVSG